MTVIIVGCGPAGVAVAACFARRGLQVKVYDKRPHPAEVSSANTDRAFVTILNKRGRTALEEAGFDLSALTQPGTGIVEVPELVQQTNAGLLPWGRRRKYELRTPALVGDRMSFVRELVKQVEGMQLGVEFYWGVALEELHLQDRVALLRLPDGSLKEERYELLVGADGAYSKVRSELEAQVAEMRSSMVPNDQRYKVFKGVDAAGLGGDKLPPFMVFLGQAKLKFDGSTGSIFIPTVPSSSDGKACGILGMHESKWEGLVAPEDYAALLRENVKRFPEAWLGPVSKQLASRPLNVSGWRVTASQLHGPSVVLVGDAGHGVTPMTGNGMNSALEDATILGQIYDSQGHDLSALPEQFNRRRLPEAQALLWLDRTLQCRIGRRGRWHWRYAFAELQYHARRLLRFMLGPGRVDPNVPALNLSQTLMPFTQVKRRLIVEDGITGALLVTAGLAAASAANWALGSMLG